MSERQTLLSWLCEVWSEVQKPYVDDESVQNEIKWDGTEFLFYYFNKKA